MYLMVYTITVHLKYKITQIHLIYSFRKKLYTSEQDENIQRITLMK